MGFSKSQVKCGNELTQAFVEGPDQTRRQCYKERIFVNRPLTFHQNSMYNILLDIEFPK